MTTLIRAGIRGLQGCRVLRSGPGIEPLNGLACIGRTRLPTDPIGNFALTLANVVVGSSIRIETQAGALIEQRTAASASEVFNLPAFTPGNPNNALRIKVRKGSAAPKYLPFDTQATAAPGSQSVFVAQVLDPIA